jgi:hypothetical protein
MENKAQKQSRMYERRRKEGREKLRNIERCKKERRK